MFQGRYITEHCCIVKPVWYTMLRRLRSKGYHSLYVPFQHQIPFYSVVLTTFYVQGGFKCSSQCFKCPKVEHLVQRFRCIFLKCSKVAPYLSNRRCLSCSANCSRSSHSYAGRKVLSTGHLHSPQAGCMATDYSVHTLSSSWRC